MMQRFENSLTSLQALPFNQFKRELIVTNDQENWNDMQKGYLTISSLNNLAKMFQIDH